MVVVVAGFVAVTVLGAAFAELLDGVLDGEGVAGIDKPFNVFLTAHRTRAATVIFTAVTNVGGAMALSWLVVVVLALVAWRMRAWWPVWVGALALGGTELFVFAIKLLVERPRPDVAIAAARADGYSFPSGHATSSVVAFGLLAWLTTTLLLTRRAARAAVWAVAVIMATAVGVSRLYLGVHYLSDVLGGWALGTGWLVTVLLAATTGTQAGRRRPSLRSGPPGAGTGEDGAGRPREAETPS
ncbi:phosphatase PAP2 family protein [Kribbella sp. NPDC055110]